MPTSLADYVGRMKEGQPAIYYLLGDDERSALHSPHLDVLRHYNYPARFPRNLRGPPGPRPAERGRPLA